MYEDTSDESYEGILVEGREIHVEVDVYNKCLALAFDFDIDNFTLKITERNTDPSLFTHCIEPKIANTILCCLQLSAMSIMKRTTYNVSFISKDEQPIDRVTDRKSTRLNSSH